ncbi:putative ABC transporter ATP-binding protein YxlF [Frondihabitans sp. 762G35]|nr:putative ABC transporter ATP-binding protein YxlF [Frondihabitans sp. 762G35]
MIPGESGIEVSNLTKTYKSKTVVDDVSFAAERGQITALLGPNGSGKSTTMRMMLDLAPPTSGRATFCGTPYRDLPHPGTHVGVSLDASAQHEGRSVWETARLAGLMLRVPRTTVRDHLEAVGLSTVHRRRVGALSLGMRQRLGLALALLGSPACLVLDEPGNGLDPEGMRWLSDHLLSFARDGGAVILSSHHLREIEVIADHAVILDRGRVSYDGPSRLSGTTTHVDSLDNVRLASALERRGITTHQAANGLNIDAEAEVVGAVALTEQIVVTHLSSVSTRLESFFLETTSGEFSGTAARSDASPEERLR